MHKVEEYAQLIAQFESGSYFRLLGFSIVQVERGSAVLQLERKPENDNMQNVLHGGAIMSGLDIAMGLASRSLGSNAVSTIQMEVRFVKSLEKGTASFHAQLMHESKSTEILTGRVLSSENELLAYATGTFKL